MIRLTALSASLAAALLLVRASPAGELTVRYDRGRLSVTAKTTPLGDILEEVGRRVGLTVMGAEEVGEPISIEFSNLPRDEALRRLLARVNHVIVVEPTPPRGELRPTRAQIFGMRGVRSSGTRSPAMLAATAGLGSAAGEIPEEVAVFGDAALNPGVTDDPEEEPADGGPPSSPEPPSFTDEP